MIRRIGIFVVLSLAACPRSGFPETLDAVRVGLTAADRAWSDGQWELSTAILEELDAPQDPQIAWRLSRAHALDSLCVSPPDALARLGLARAEGIACLEGGAAQRTTSESFVSAVSREPYGPCHLWTTWAFARWMIAFGSQAAAIDAEALRALTAVLRAQPEGDPDLAWALALSALALGEAAAPPSGSFLAEIDPLWGARVPQGEARSEVELRCQMSLQTEQPASP